MSSAVNPDPERCACEQWSLSYGQINYSDSARSKTRLRNLPTFKFGNLDVELVEDYIYFGIRLNWNSSFVK